MRELIGTVEDIDISDISPPQNILRCVLQNVNELAHSIKRIGL
jgi:hypothetical protein